MTVLVESQLFKGFRYNFCGLFLKFYHAFGLGWSGRGYTPHLLHLREDFLDDGGRGWRDRGGGLR